MKKIRPSRKAPYPAGGGPRAAFGARNPRSLNEQVLKPGGLGVLEMDDAERVRDGVCSADCIEFVDK
jgi:hypothetical protein